MSIAGTRVFLVEDEAPIRLALQDMLEEPGCIVADVALVFATGSGRAPLAAALMATA